MKYLLAFFILFTSLILGTHAHAAEQTMCYDLYKPVCAAQIVECFAAPCYPQYHTYSNECFAQSAHATILHEGECTATETGPVRPAATAPPVVHSTPWHSTTTTTTSTGATSSTFSATTSSSTPPHPTPLGLFHRLWNTILSWFKFFKSRSILTKFFEGR